MIRTNPHDGINHQIIPCPRSAIKIYTSPARHTRFPELLVPAGPISARLQILGTRHQRRLKYGYVNKLPDPDQTRRLKVAPSSFREVIPTTSMKCHTLFRFILYFRFVFFFFANQPCAHVVDDGRVVLYILFQFTKQTKCRPIADRQRALPYCEEVGRSEVHLCYQGYPICAKELTIYETLKTFFFNYIQDLFQMLDYLKSTCPFYI